MVVTPGFDCLTKMSPVVKVSSKTFKNWSRYLELCVIIIKTYAIVFRASLYSPAWLLCNSCQALLSLATDVMVLIQCAVHANGSPEGCHWHEPSNGQWHM